MPARPQFRVSTGLLRPVVQNASNKSPAVLVSGQNGLAATSFNGVAIPGQAVGTGNAVQALGGSGQAGVFENGSDGGGVCSYAGGIAAPAPS